MYNFHVLLNVNNIEKFSESQSTYGLHTYKLIVFSII